MNTSDIGNKINNIIAELLNDYDDDRNINQIDTFSQPDSKAIDDILYKLFKIIYPGFYQDHNYKYYSQKSRLSVLMEDVAYNLNKQITVALLQLPEYKDGSFEKRSQKSGEIVEEFFRRLSKVRQILSTDVDAFFEGDPAAYNNNEIILCYPGLYAITVARLAHELFELKVPLIPRMMTEHAHSKTGIDIHPGATIGRYFFIDHGTGIVIGETTVIGEYVKIYQGVTLGGLSTRGGQSLKGTKRHPTIEDRVTIYAGASILGGETVIGHDTVIGSNAFITQSVAPNSRASIKNVEMNISNSQPDKH